MRSEKQIRQLLGMRKKELVTYQSCNLTREAYAVQNQIDDIEWIIDDQKQVGSKFPKDDKKEVKQPAEKPKVPVVEEPKIPEHKDPFNVDMPDFSDDLKQLAGDVENGK